MNRSRPTVVITAALLTVLPIKAWAADSPWLYGLHWYRTDGDLESLTGGKGIWLLETVMVWEGGWSAGSQKGKFETAVAHGHTIICRIQPVWGYAVPPENQMAAYLSAVTSAAQTLRNECHIWQIGNEMNNPGEYGGQPLLPAVYVDRFKRIRDAIRSVSSPLGPQVVLLGPPSPAGGHPYLRSMLSDLTLADVDGFALHAYGLDSSPLVVDSVLNFQTVYREQLAVIDEYGFQHKPVFITEFDRCTHPANSSTQEPVSSQFLQLAFEGLHAWNNTPGNHPVVGAVWFIYPDDGAWACFSLRRHKSGPRGPNVNLWDAYQFAATHGYPAGATQAALHVNATNLTYRLRVGASLPPDGFDVLNAGGGILNYTVNSHMPWLVASPSSGSASGEVDRITLHYHMDDYPPGLYAASVSVLAGEVAGSPAVITVEIEVLPLPGDLDGDGDVDQSDFGLLQACYSGGGTPQLDPTCRLARLDADPDVDGDDFGIFQNCMSGPGAPSDPTCAD